VPTSANKALEAARAEAAKRAKEAPKEEVRTDAFELSDSECYIRLVIEMYASGCGVSMGVMPDGMAQWVRLRYPTSSKSSFAGLVAFAVHNDPTTVLQKAVQALDASPNSQWWKPDRYAEAAPK